MEKLRKIFSKCPDTVAVDMMKVPGSEPSENFGYHVLVFVKSQTQKSPAFLEFALPQTLLKLKL